MAVPSQSTTISIGNADGPPETFAVIGEVTSISGPQSSRSQLDVTALGDSIRRTAAGLLDPGEVTLNLRLNFGDTGQDLVRTRYFGNTRSTFRIGVPLGALGGGASSAATTITFSGWITAYTPVSAEVDGLITSTVTIRLDSTTTEA
jgi:hypothetical protein